MIFIYKMMEIKICVSLREHHDVIFAENDAAAYTPCLAYFESYLNNIFTNKS